MENRASEISDWIKVKTISDRYGEEYHVILFDDQVPAFKVLTADARIQQVAVGYANCLYEDTDILKLADIQIRDDIILVYRRTGLFRAVQKVRREKKNFQQRGLGSELLKCVFDFAITKGVKRIVGKIKSLDYSKNPKLPKWYADMGFTVTMETEQSAAEGRISKELQAR